VASLSFMKLFHRRRAARQIESQRLKRTPEELERDRDLLERVAAGIALNKTPGR
jgi:ribonucleotide reductase alpha subunit